MVTRKKNTIGRLVLILTVVGIFLSDVKFLYAAPSSASHAVSVTVPPVLSLTASATSFTLTYSDYLAGSESDIQSVTYNAMCNGLTPSGRVEVRLGALTPGMDFKADAQPYAKQSGSASLVKANSGYQTVGTAGVKMYDQKTDSDSGMTTRGSFVVNYKVTATTDLGVGTYVVASPTVTLFTT